MFGLIRRWRRKRLLKAPFPPAWRNIMDERLPFFRRLDRDVKAKLERGVQIFIAEKHFFGAGGFEITEEVKVVVAASAVRLVVHKDISPYDRLTEIIVYPSAYRHPDSDEGTAILGEAHQWGTVVLAWDAVVHGLNNPCDGHDTAIHEFAHVLDRDGGGFDGTPELRATGDYAPWGQVMSRHFLNLRDDEDSAEGEVMRDYGATNEAEFFAVATETFFEKPWQMRETLPDLFDQLVEFYGFDPTVTGTGCRPGR